MSNLPPNYNVIQQNLDLPYIEQLNKTLFDQAVLLQPTISYADFYALMPTDNASTIAAGSDIAFPRLGSTSASDIVRATASSFTLGPIGVYNIQFQVGVTDAVGSQLVLTLNGVQQASTVVGIVGSGSINGSTILTTTVVNSVITVRNPSGNARAITVTASLGGASPVAAHLVVTRLR